MLVGPDDFVGVGELSGVFLDLAGVFRGLGGLFLDEVGHFL